MKKRGPRRERPMGKPRYVHDLYVSRLIVCQSLYLLKSN